MPLWSAKVKTQDTGQFDMLWHIFFLNFEAGVKL